MTAESLHPRFCSFCGVPLCSRQDDPFQLVFFHCHHCGGPTTCPPRPSQRASSQTPLEWAAFSSDAARDTVLTDFLAAFSDKATASMKAADAKDDVAGGFMMTSPHSARQQLSSVMASHEEAIMHLKRIHEAEVRKLRSQLDVAAALNTQLQAEVARLEGQQNASWRSAQDMTDTVEEVRASAVLETERKWRMVSDRESSLRAERDGEVYAAWRLLVSAAQPRSV
jgi:hypothetical protein